MVEQKRIIFKLVCAIAVLVLGLHIMFVDKLVPDFSNISKHVPIKEYIIKFKERTVPLFEITPTEGPPLPWIYVITPTYNRYTQMPDMTRLSNTLLHIKRLHWIVIEDALHENKPIKELLQNSGITHTYIVQPKIANVSLHLRGVAQRNAGLNWIRKHHNVSEEEGVIYFADDDNSYTLRLFHEIRYTKKVSIFPVGGEKILVKKGKVVGFISWQSQTRKFAVDMASFAINVRVLFDYPNMHFGYKCTPGHQETKFLEQCCTLNDLEPKGDNCTKELFAGKAKNEVSQNRKEGHFVYADDQDDSLSVCSLSCSTL